MLVWEFGKKRLMGCKSKSGVKVWACNFGHHTGLTGICLLSRCSIQRSMSRHASICMIMMKYCFQSEEAPSISSVAEIAKNESGVPVSTSSMPLCKESPTVSTPVAAVVPQTLQPTAPPIVKEEEAWGKQHVSQTTLCKLEDYVNLQMSRKQRHPEILSLPAAMLNMNNPAITAPHSHGGVAAITTGLGPISTTIPIMPPLPVPLNVPFPPAGHRLPLPTLPVSPFQGKSLRGQADPLPPNVQVLPNGQIRPSASGAQLPYVKDQNSFIKWEADATASKRGESASLRPSVIHHTPGALQSTSGSSKKQILNPAPVQRSHIPQTVYGPPNVTAAESSLISTHKRSYPFPPSSPDNQENSSLGEPEKSATKAKRPKYIPTTAPVLSSNPRMDSSPVQAQAGPNIPPMADSGRPSSQLPYQPLYGSTVPPLSSPDNLDQDKPTDLSLKSVAQRQLQYTGGSSNPGAPDTGDQPLNLSMKAISSDTRVGRSSPVQSPPNVAVCVPVPTQSSSSLLDRHRYPYIPVNPFEDRSAKTPCQLQPSANATKSGLNNQSTVCECTE